MTQNSLIEATRDYLARYFVSAQQLGAALGVSGADVEALVDAGLLPHPSYTVSNGQLVSVAFGDLDGEGLADGAYFHTGMAHWLERALQVRDQAEPAPFLKEAFIAQAVQARAELAARGWIAPDRIDAEDAPDPQAVTAWLEDLWQSHMEGIFGVCVRQPDRVDQIVLKETMQAILTARTENGSRADYTSEETTQIRDLVDRYAMACADFTPMEYPISSRCRYLEGLRLPTSN